MKNISLEGKGMAGVIATMERVFGDAIRKAGGAALKEDASRGKTVPASAIVGADCNHVLGIADDWTWDVDDGCNHDIPVTLGDFQRDDFKDKWHIFNENFRAYNFCPLCGISVTTIIQDFRAQRDKELSAFASPLRFKLNGDSASCPDRQHRWDTSTLKRLDGKRIIVCLDCGELRVDMMS